MEAVDTIRLDSFYNHTEIKVQKDFKSQEEFNWTNNLIFIAFFAILFTILIKLKNRGKY